MSRVDQSTIRSRLDEAGYDVASVERVSVTLSGDETTYSATTGDGRMLFVQTITAEQRDVLSELVAADEDFGTPIERILAGDPALLVMRTAPGRPLSRLLPVLLAPLAWRRHRDGLAAAFERLGACLGRLHAATADRTVPFGDVSGFDLLRVEPVLDREFPASTMERLRSIVERIRAIDTPEAVVHSDPTPHNCYYSRGTLTLIDLGVDRGPPVKDLLVAEQGVELMVARLPYGRRSQRERLIDAFRRGYRTENGPLGFPSPIYDGLKLCAYTSLLARYHETESKTLRARITGYVDPPILRGFVEERLAAIDEEG